jgi:hypothetical protein
MNQKVHMSDIDLDAPDISRGSSLITFGRLVWPVLCGTLPVQPDKIVQPNWDDKKYPKENY